MTLDIRPLVDGLSVAPQVTEEDIRAAHAAGFRSIVNNRPDGEEPGQLPSAEAARIAAGLGMAYVYMPAIGPTLDAVSDDFGKALAALPGPVLAHCRSGTRCTILWALAEAKAGTSSGEEIFRTAAAAGYDLSSYAALIDRYAQSRV
ncbi:TIGR01244 family sulfur transferase [Niveispirillum fermenti]|uniref:TIGR01244 family sulfur transferase n=1 Tax=Niveispirillum fermenti TaxID=1233113 RepID=UPI003A869D3A